MISASVMKGLNMAFLMDEYFFVSLIIQFAKINKIVLSSTTHLKTTLKSLSKGVSLSVFYFADWQKFPDIITVNLSFNYRSSRPEMFCKKYVLKNLLKSIRKHMCQSQFFNQVPGLRPVTLLKKRLWRRCLTVNFKKFLRRPFLK